MIDTTTIVWFAVICGVLSVFALSDSRHELRIVIGAVVGIIVASLLPYVKSMNGILR